jgi:alkanesulfonate monooxygenase SsuD/methylene tetrahydromethanopterin reductase-like flavin-dependent oxidoreductase (luciferase family)
MSLTFGVHYDFRNPAQWRQRWADCYAQALEQIEWVDDNTAFNSVFVSEHHLLDDGYMPSTMAMAAAVAARTSRVGIGTNILPLPLQEVPMTAPHEPRRRSLGDAASHPILVNGNRGSLHGSV